MARLKKRKDGRYAKQVTVGVKNGKPFKKYLYGKTEKELDKKYRDLMLLVDRQVALDIQDMTVAEIMREWYRITKEGKIRRNTECSYASYMKRIEMKIGEVKVKKIKRYDIECFINDIQKEGFSNTAQSILKILKEMFDYAVSNDIVHKNPCSWLSVKYKQKQKRSLTDNEKLIIESEIIDIREKALLYLLRYTGIRRGELFALTKSDIDKNQMIIHINKTVIDNNGKPYIQDTTKTDAGIRVVPIFRKLAEPLFEYSDTVQDALFLNRNGGIMASNSVQYMFKSIIKKYGLGEDLTMHCFRHNFISECYAAGVDIKRVQYWVGHDNINTTLNIYTRLSKAALIDGTCMNEYYDNL